MKVKLGGDELYPVYGQSDWGVEVDIPDAVWDEWEDIDLQWNQFQNLFDELVDDAKKKQILENSKQGVQPRGFN